MLGFVTIVCMNLTHLCPENQPSSWYIIILTVLLVIVVDTLSGWLRRRLIHGRRHSQSAIVTTRLSAR